MNRAERRANIKARRRDSFAAQYIDNYECPDCQSEVIAHDLGDACIHLEIRHDDTCPNFRQMKGTP